MENRMMGPIALHAHGWGMSQRTGQGLGVAGTYDSLVCSAGVKFNSADIVAERHHAIKLTDAVSTAAIFAHALNTRYKNGTDITAHIYWTTTLTGFTDLGNGRFNFGLTHKGTDGILGDETDTEYIGITEYLGPAGGNNIIKTTVTFDGSLHGGLVQLDEMAMIIIRDGGHANDTLDDDVLILGVDWIYTIESLGQKQI